MQRRLDSLEEYASRIASSDHKAKNRLIECLLDECKSCWKEILDNIKSEEDGFFPILEHELGDSSEVVQAMRGEHGEIISGMTTILRDIVRSIGRQDSQEEKDGLVDRIRQFRSFMNEHIHREDKILFWFADLHLSPSDRKKVSAGR